MSKPDKGSGEGATSPKLEAKLPSSSSSSYRAAKPVMASSPRADYLGNQARRAGDDSERAVLGTSAPREDYLGRAGLRMSNSSLFAQSFGVPSPSQVPARDRGSSRAPHAVPAWCKILLFLGLAGLLLAGAYAVLSAW